MENRTRTFEATYTHKDGKKDKLKIRVNPRLVSLFLALALTASTTACSFSSNSSDKDLNDKKTDMTLEEQDLEAIKKIIEDHPEMLAVKESTTHIVKVDETLSGIAAKYGTTVNEIKRLNQEKLNGKTTIYPGEELIVEYDTKLNDKDRDINILESYIFDYVLRESSFAKKANSDNTKNDSSLHKVTLFGYPKDDVTIDPNSINGQAIRVYTTYHENENENTDENKTKYISILKNIVLEISEATKDIGLLIPYSQYEIYCLNKSIEHDELIESIYTPYGDVIQKTNGM